MATGKSTVKAARNRLRFCQCKRVYSYTITPMLGARPVRRAGVAEVKSFGRLP